jgi:phosphatidylinositol-3-phosphatase
MWRVPAWLLGALSVLLLVACASEQPAPARRGNSAEASARLHPSPTAPSNGPNHIVVIVMENKEYGSIIGSTNAPYLNRLARRNVLLTHEYAITHPSLPNYLALTGGSTFGVSSDCTRCYLRKRSLVDELEREDISWKAYMESMPRPCYKRAFAGKYAKKHNPFIYYNGIRNNRQRCDNIVPFRVLKRRDLRSGLPDFVWITPNECHNMHDCRVRTGDRFLRHWVPRIIAHIGRDGIVIVTFDEGSSNDGCCSLGSAGGRVATIIAGPGARNDTTIRHNEDHYSLLRLIEDAWGLPRMRHAGDRSTPTIRDWQA